MSKPKIFVPQMVLKLNARRAVVSPDNGDQLTVNFDPVQRDMPDLVRTVDRGELLRQNYGDDVIVKDSGDVTRASVARSTSCGSYDALKYDTEIL